MRLIEVWVFLIGLFGFANVLMGWMGAGIDLGVVRMPADWLGYICLGVAVVLSLLGRKRHEHQRSLNKGDVNDMSEDSEELNRMIQLELDHIPKGDSIQNELRMLYNSTRRKRKWRSKTKEEVLDYCIERLMGKNPSFTPRFNRDFFKTTRF